MVFQRERFLVRCIAAMIGVRLLAALAVVLMCLGGWSASRRVCADAGDALEAVFETALATALALLSSTGLRAVSQRAASESGAAAVNHPRAAASFRACWAAVMQRWPRHLASSWLWARSR